MVLFLNAVILSGTTTAFKCPCSHPRLCDPIRFTPKKEVSSKFVYSREWANVEVLSGVRMRWGVYLQKQLFYRDGVRERKVIVV